MQGVRRNQQDDTRVSKNSIVVTVAKHVHNSVVLVNPASCAGINNEEIAAEVLFLPWSNPQWIHRKSRKPRAGRAQSYSQRHQGSGGRARTHSRSSHASTLGHLMISCSAVLTRKNPNTIRSLKHMDVWIMWGGPPSSHAQIMPSIFVRPKRQKLAGWPYASWLGLATVGRRVKPP
jgi:hypothetical protein